MTNSNGGVLREVLIGLAAACVGAAVCVSVGHRPAAPSHTRSSQAPPDPTIIHGTAGAQLDDTYQWLPGGKLITFYIAPDGPDGPDGILPTVIDLRTGQRRKLTKVAPLFVDRTGLEVINGCRQLLPSPQGDWILFATYHAKTPGWKAVSTDGTRLWEWLGSGKNNVPSFRQAAWLRDDRHWVELTAPHGRCALIEYGLNERDGRILPIPAHQSIGDEQDPNVHEAKPNTWELYDLVGFDRGGSLIATGMVNETSALIRIRLNSHPLQCELLRAAREPNDFDDARISPDGKHLAYFSSSLCVSSLDGTGEHHLGYAGAYPDSLRWLPDGKHLSYCVGPDELHIVSTNAPMPSKSAPAANAAPS